MATGNVRIAVNSSEKEEDDEIDEVEQVCQFLKRRNVSLEVVENFRKNKMDKLAVWHSLEGDLEELGLTSKGDIITLKGFCLPHDKTGDKRKLANLVRNTISERPTGRGPVKKSMNRLLNRNIGLGWMNYDNKKNKYITIRMSKGGGVRFETFPNTADKKNVLDRMMTLFFPDEKSRKKFNFELGNYRGEIIKEEQFCLADYIKQHCLSKTRLYLMTKEKSSLNKLLESLASENEFSDDEDDFVIAAPKKPNSSSQASALIGTSDERLNLNQEIDKAYEESLAADMKKEEERQDHEMEQVRLMSLMECRKSRVEPEPDLSEPHVTISVRHISIGNKVRLFEATSLFQCVYDWVGSISLKPEHFELRDFDNSLLVPDSEVYSGSFNMVEVTVPVLMSPSGTVSFKGFGTKADVKKDEPESNGMVNYLESSADVKNDANYEDSYSLLQELRQAAREKLNPTAIYAEVERDEIYKEMMSLYNKRNTLSHVFHISFKDENAVGDGVSRDAYSAFFESVYSKMEGHFEKVPSPCLEEDELNILGKVMTHAFILFDVFPVALCKASMKKVIFGEVSNSELLASFMQFIPPREVDIVHQYKDGSIKNAQPIIDILSEYSIFNRLTPDNIMPLMEKAARVALIRKPFFSVKILVEGMGSFWNKVTSDMFESIYSCSIPKAENVIEKLIANESCPRDQNITTWVHRYIRSCTNHELLRFIRCVTGSTNFPPNTRIKMEFIDQAKGNLRPYAKTCFKIFVIPRQYSSFTELSDNLNFHIGHPSNWAVYDS